MFKRSISLYFGSVTIWRSFQGIWIWFTNLFCRTEAERDCLHHFVKHQYYPDSQGVFSLGSARSALSICLKAAGISEGDEVLVSAYTCLAVPTAIIAIGAKPVYFDIDAESLNGHEEIVLQQLTVRTKAIIAQHTLGKPMQIKKLLQKAHARGILVIEDCALALGSKKADQFLGSFGDAAIFSMELSKTLSVGWGGILVVNDLKLSKQVDAIYQHLSLPTRFQSGRDLWQVIISSWCYHPLILGTLGRYILALCFKLKIFRPSTPALEFSGVVADNFISKMACSQIRFARLQWKHFDKTTSACEKNAYALRSALIDLGVKVPGTPLDNEFSVAPRISVLVKDKPLILNYFKHYGIELGVWFNGPLSPLPEAEVFNYRQDDYPVAKEIAAEIINFPCHSRIKKQSLYHMIHTLIKFNEAYPECLVKA